MHLAECKDAKPAFPCKVCGVMFKNEIFVREHMKTHQTEEGFKCVQCNAVFSVKRTLVRHMVIHDTNRPLQCSYCRDRFDSRDEYKEHLSMYHSNTFAVVGKFNVFLFFPEKVEMDGCSDVAQANTL